jgi:hypothetical protein
LNEYGNGSFQIELPAHFEQRGVHDLFHASLLRIHIPNDDRLFPGCLDTQIGNADGTEGEWAMDSILGHAGSKVKVTFEIRLKTRDVTWLLYYQVSHLHALQQYFDLLGIANISQLPEGEGKPPLDDPQTFIGNMETEIRPMNKRKKDQHKGKNPRNSLLVLLRLGWSWADFETHDFSDM